MLHYLTNNLKRLFKRKPEFTFGEKDSSGFRTLYKNGKETNLRLYHFEQHDIKKLQEIAEEFHEQKGI